MKTTTGYYGPTSSRVVLNEVAKLAFSKAFGPAQTYFDGTVTPADQPKAYHCQQLQDVVR